MNYYRRYPGDYARATGHLTLVEHGVYTLLLDSQYATERELPESIDALYRICRARTAEEEAAVRSVVEQFFPANAHGRMNPRAERQIPDEQVRILTARENGKLGGRKPKANPAGNPSLTHGLNSPSPSPSPSPSSTPTPKNKCASDDALLSRVVSDSENAEPEGFAEFYDAYPIHKDRLRACRAWKKLNPNHELIGIIMAALKRHKAEVWNGNGQFNPAPPYPAKWLNDRRWEDEATKPEATPRREPKPADGEPRSAVPVWTPREQPSPTSNPETAKEQIGFMFAAIGRRRGHPPAATEPTKGKSKKRKDPARDEQHRPAQ